MEIDRDSLELLREKRAELNAWPSGPTKEAVLRAIDAVIADIEAGIVSFVGRPANAELGEDGPHDHADD